MTSSVSFMTEGKVRHWHKNRNSKEDTSKRTKSRQDKTGSDNGSSRPDLTQSVDLTRRDSGDDEDPSCPLFTQSVMVVPSSDASGTYSIYPAAHVGGRTSQEDKDADFTASLYESFQYEHNINHPGRETPVSNDQVGGTRSSQKTNQCVASDDATDFVSDDGIIPSSSCDCVKYHTHTFESEYLLMSYRQMSLRKEPLTPRTKEILPHNVVAANNLHMSICNVFWKAKLSFCSYKHGDANVSFSSLWPSTKDIESLLREGLEEVGLGNALWELCMLCMLGAPFSLLKCMLDYKYITPDYQPDNDASLLHLACLLQNQEAVQLLISSQTSVSPKIKDKTGMTIGDVCFSSKLRRQLPAKFQSSTLYDKTRQHRPVTPGEMDRDAIFRNASHPRYLYELLKKLQMFLFDVNTEHDEEGNSLLHVAVTSGISQLPLLLCLVHQHKAYIDVCNNSGLTPLMVVVQQDDQTLCDAMVCLFGANPNKQNSQNGKTALHYAAEGNHIGIVDCLLNRGADVNIEDEDMRRPGDPCVAIEMTNECQERIQSQREQRLDMLKQKISEDTIQYTDVQPTDMSVVDDNGCTLIMYAASQNRHQCLEVLLKVSTRTIDAQHFKTGHTALAMAAKAGHHECCRILLSYGASVLVRDMQGFLPLHQAVLNNQELAITEFNNPDNFTEDRLVSGRPKDAYVGLHEALRLCRRRSIHEKLTNCWEKRQEEIVNPLLRLYAMEGDAEKLYNVLEDGDNLNSRDNLNNQTALFVAIEHGNLEVIQLLVERGSDVQRRDAASGDSILHLVAHLGNLNIAHYLLDISKSAWMSRSHDSRLKLDINAVNFERKTALHVAAEKGFVKFVNLLISYGASTSLLDNDGRLFSCPQFEGVRLQIELARRQHTKMIMSLVSDKNKKALHQLEKHWLPCFDHNLRDATGDTPLMVASRQGLVHVVNFLLQSAVYTDDIEAYDDNDAASDADSGVPDLPVHQPQLDEVYNVMDKSVDYTDNLPLGASCDHLTQSLTSSRPSMMYEPRLSSHKTEGSRQMGHFLSQASRPQGLSIYHDGLVSHVCAVNPHSGNTALHSCLTGDYPDVAMALVGADMAVLNMQNNNGLTAVHLACKLGRKKCLKKLLAVSGVDLNLYSLEGQLPEDLTSNNRIIKLVQQARRGHPIRSAPSRASAGASILSESLPSSSHQSEGASTINFDKIDHRYQSLRQGKAPSHINSSKR